MLAFTLYYFRKHKVVTKTFFEILPYPHFLQFAKQMLSEQELKFFLHGDPKSIDTNSLLQEQVNRNKRKWKFETLVNIIFINDDKLLDLSTALWQLYWVSKW